MKKDAESRVAYHDRVCISHKHDKQHVCLYLTLF